MYGSHFDTYMAALNGGLGNLAGKSSRKIFSSTVAAWEQVKSLRPAVMKQAQSVMAKIDQVSGIANAARSAISQAESEISGGSSDFFSFSAPTISTEGIDSAEATAEEMRAKVQSIVDDVQSGAMSHQTGSSVAEQAQLDAAAGVSPDWGGWAGALSQYQSDLSGMTGKLAQLVRNIQQAATQAQRQAQTAIKTRQAAEQRARQQELAAQRAEEARMRAEQQREQAALQAEQRRIDAELRREQAQRDAEMRREQQQIAAEQARQQAELQREQQRMMAEQQLEAQRAAMEQQRLQAELALQYPVPTVPSYPGTMTPIPTSPITPAPVAPAPVVASPFPDVNYADPNVIAQAQGPTSWNVQQYTAPQPTQQASDWFYGEMFDGNGGGGEMFGMSGMGAITAGVANPITWGGKSAAGATSKGTYVNSSFGSTNQVKSGSNFGVKDVVNEENIELAKQIANSLRPGTFKDNTPPPPPEPEIPTEVKVLGAVAVVGVLTKIAGLW